MGERKRRLAQGDPPAPAGRAPDLDGHLSEARALLERGRAGDAFARAQQALALAPRHPEALHLLGRCCMAIGQTETGIGLLQAAVAAQPQDAGMRSSLGRALAQGGRLQDAAEHLGRASAGSADAQLLRDLGAVLVHLGRAREAEDAYARAAELSPERADLHEALARLRYERNALDQAQESFRRSLALDAALLGRLNIGSARADAGIAHGDIDPPQATPQQARPAWQAVKADIAALSVANAKDPSEALRVACEARSLLVLDDFIDDPVGYRDRALKLQFHVSASQAGVNYPGRQTAAQPCDAIMQRIARALGRDIKWDSPDNGAFRISPADASARNDIHVDSDVRNDIYAGVLYLSLPEHCRGGTLFWRHRASGWERRPAPEQLAAGGYATFKQFEKRWMPVDRLRPFTQLQAERDAAWERVLEVPMRFNRLTVYRSDFFHSIGELFGDRPENSRFVQLFFFEASGVRT